MSAPSVFLLDDDVAVCRVLNRMLSLEEYEVRTSHSVAEAVTAIEEKSFDAYVLDYRLLDGTGLDVAERVRSNGSSAPIILISGYDLAGISSQAEELRVFDMIQKPFSSDALCSVLKQSIEPEPIASPNNAGEVVASPAAPVAPERRLTSAVRIGAIILLLIVVGVIIYLQAIRH